MPGAVYMAEAQAAGGFAEDNKAGGRRSYVKQHLGGALQIIMRRAGSG
jgi:hypothetical protein